MRKNLITHYRVYRMQQQIRKKSIRFGFNNLKTSTIFGTSIYI